MNAVDQFTPAQWQGVYDTTPLGHTAASKRFGGFELIRSLGDSGNAEKLGNGRVNFLSYCGSKYGTAIQVLTAFELGQATELDVIAGYGPFMKIVPPSAIGLQGDLVDLWQDDRRRVLIDQLKLVVGGDPTIRPALMPSDAPADSLHRYELAICLESVRWSGPVNRHLDEWFVDLCRLDDAGRPVQRDDAGLLKCQNERLGWLGLELTERTGAFSSGADAVKRTRGNNDLVLIAGATILVFSGVGLYIAVMFGNLLGLALIPAAYAGFGIAYLLGRLAERDAIPPMARTAVQLMAVAVAWLLPLAVAWFLLIAPVFEAPAQR